MDTAPTAAGSASEGRKAAGERRKRVRSTRPAAPLPPAGASEPSCSADTTPLSACCASSASMRLRTRCVSISFMEAGVRPRCSSSASTTKRTPASLVHSRSSFIVKAACTWPRRPTRCTRRTRERLSASSAWSAMSVLRSSSTDLHSTRAQSTATLPWPTTTTSSQSRFGDSSAKSGCPLYHPTNSRAECTPRRSSPGRPMDRSLCAP
mmetsp:Transcript_19092/g.67436  ORF Transcript_19092/g.67436 Transcript_19092/m.67436 type:complete len:208 (+) Transcript_19092:315-938(+)